MPERIQLQRTRGWRKPDGAIVVSRPSRWGNPYRITKCNRVECGPEVTRWCVVVDSAEHRWHEHSRLDAQRLAVALFAELLTRRGSPLSEVTFRGELSDLVGSDLACWCPLVDENGQRVPCHADVLLEIANGGPA